MKLMQGLALIGAFFALLTFTTIAAKSDESGISNPSEQASPKETTVDDKQPAGTEEDSNSKPSEDSPAPATTKESATTAPGSAAAPLATVKKYTPTQIQDIYRYIQDSQRLFKEKKIAESRAMLEKAIGFDPSPYSMHAHYTLGAMFDSEGNQEAALKEYDKAIQFKPTSEKTLLTIGERYRSDGMMAKALACYEKFTYYYSSSVLSPRIRNMIEELRTAGLDADSQDLKAPDYLTFGAHKHLQAWPRERLPLRVYIQSGSGIRGYHDQYSKYLILALNEWCLASRNRINWTLVNDPKYADLTCSWVSAQSQFAGGDGGSKAGLTRRYGWDLIEKAEVQIWTMYLGDDEIKSTCLHEVGHALGLDHSPNRGDVLYCALQPKVPTQLSERDKATIARLYREHAAWSPQKQKVVKSTFSIEYASPEPPKPAAQKTGR